jgi:hypothetical protein
MRQRTFWGRARSMNLICMRLLQTEITDIVRRRGVFGQRMKQVPATGQPSRFFEETAIPSPTAAQAFVDPRNIAADAGARRGWSARFR